MSHDYITTFHRGTTHRMVLVNGEQLSIGQLTRLMLTAASLHLHVLQASEQRLVGLTHLLLVPPHVFQRLLNLLLFPL